MSQFRPSYLSFLIYITLILFNFPSCTPSSSPSSSASSSPIFQIPDHIDLYGGSDRFQAWVNSLQSYAQKTSPQVPAFGMMVPLFLGQAFGIQNTQQLNFNQPLRWYAQVPKNLKEQEKMKLALAFYIKDPKTIKQSLSPTMWKEIEGQNLVFQSLNPAQPGQLFVKGRVVILTNDPLFANETLRSNLIDYLDQPLSPHFKIFARSHLLKSQLKSLTDTGLKSLLNQGTLDPNTQDQLMNQDLQALYEDIDSLVDTMSFNIEAFSKRLTIEVGAQLDINHPFYPELQTYFVDASPLLKEASPQAQGFVFINPLNLNQNGVSLLKKNQLVSDDFQLPQAGNSSALFTVNTQLELNGLIQGQGSQLHKAFKKLATTLLPKFNTLPDAKVQYMLQTEKMDDHPVELLKMTKFPKKDPSTPPKLSDLDVQLSEIRSLFLPNRVLMTFGPKSHTHLKKLQALRKAQSGGIFERPDFNELRSMTQNLMFLFYLTPQSIHHSLSLFQSQSSPLPPKVKNFEQEGLSFLISQLDQSIVMQINLPLETTQSLVSPLIRLFTQGGGFKLP